MRRLAVLLLLALSGCPEGPAEQPPKPTAPARPVVATLSGLKGGVSLTRDGARKPATPGPLFEGDLLETDEAGHAVLTAGGRVAELLENSRFKVGPTLGQLELSLGELILEDLDGGELQTGAGSARFGAGSRISVQAGDGGTRFEVGLGTLELFDLEDGGSSTVKAGERFVVGMDGLILEDVPQPAPPPSPEKPKVKLSARGAVTVKPKSGKSARVPAEGTELAEQGSFSVERGSQLRAERGGTVAEFESASKGSLEPSEADPKLRATLAAGGARVFMQEGESLLLEGKKPLLVRAKSSATYLVTATKNGPRVEVLGGDLELSLAGALPRNVSAGEVATPKGKGLDTGKRGSPSVVLPAGRSSRVHWGRASEVGLALPDGEGEVEVAADSGFESLLVTAKASELLVVPAPLKGALYWRRKGGAEVSSARFERDESAGAVGARPDTVAETGLKATVYFQSAVPTLNFTFPARAGAAAWRFRVYPVDDLKTAKVDRQVTENKAVVESGTLGEGSYVWSATPLDAAGAEQAGGRMNKMDIVFDNSVTRLVLTSPREGERGSVASGVAPLGARLSLNGKSVTLDAAGRFSTPVGGASVLVFKLTSKEGADSYWVRRLGR